MIVIPNINGEPERALTAQERATVISQRSNGVEFAYYQQGDEVPPIDYGTPIPQPNWSGLKDGLWDSTAFLKVVGKVITVNEIAFSALAMVLKDGETKGAAQSAFFRMFAALGGNWSKGDLDEINALLAANNFDGEV